MHGRRSLGNPLTPYVNKFHKFKKVSTKLDSTHQPVFEPNIEPSLNPLLEPKEMEENQPMRETTMKEFARPVIGTATAAIQLGEAARNYDLKNIHFSMLPSFYGLPNEDSLSFMRDFYATVQTFPLGILNEDQLRMRCFPYTLKDKAKAWLMSLPPGSLMTWGNIYNKFMGKFYSHQKTSELRGKIATFSQMDGEPFHEAWDRFKMFLTQCPHHSFPLQLQNQFFYDGLTQQCQFIVDNAAGGAIGEKTASETYNLFEMLGANSQQKSSRVRKAGVHEIDSSNEVQQQLVQLTKQVALLPTQTNTNNDQYGLYSNMGHGTEACPYQGETTGPEQVNVLGAYQQRPRFDPNSNTYNPGWRSHPNFSWRQNNPPFTQSSNQAGQQFHPPIPRSIPNKPTLEDNLNSFIQVCRDNQSKTNQRLDSVEASIKKVEVQVEQLVEHLQKGKD